MQHERGKKRENWITKTGDTNIGAMGSPKLYTRLEGIDLHYLVTRCFCHHYHSNAFKHLDLQ